MKKYFISKYTGILDRQVEDDKMKSIIYNSLYGTAGVFGIKETKEIRKIFSTRRKSLLLQEDRMTDFLRNQKFIIIDRKTETQFVKKFIEQFHEYNKNNLRIGIIQDDKQTMASVNNFSTFLKMFTNLFLNKIHSVNIYIFLKKSEGFNLLNSLKVSFEEMLNLCRNVNIFLISRSIEVNSDYLELPSAICSRTMFVSLIDDSWKTIYYDSQNFLKHIENSLIILGRKNIISGLIFAVTHNNFIEVLSNLVSPIFNSRIFHYCLMNIDILPQLNNYVSNLCLYEQYDWTLFFRLNKELKSLPQYSPIRIYGPSIVSQIYYLFNTQKRFYPNLIFCPWMRNGFILSPPNNIFTCLKSAEENNIAYQIGYFNQTDLKINEENLNYWRNGERILKNTNCLDCSDIFLCCGNCPRKAVDVGENECLPVGEIIGSIYNIHISRNFQR